MTGVRHPRRACCVGEPLGSRQEPGGEVENGQSRGRVRGVFNPKVSYPETQREWGPRDGGCTGTSLLRDTQAPGGSQRGGGPHGLASIHSGIPRPPLPSGPCSKVAPPRGWREGPLHSCLCCFRLRPGRCRSEPSTDGSGMQERGAPTGTEQVSPDQACGGPHPHPPVRIAVAAALRALMACLGRGRDRLSRHLRLLSSEAATGPAPGPAPSTCSAPSM